MLFAVLPFGVRSQHEDGAVAPGTDPGAPAIPQLMRKLIWTTLVAGVVFALCFLIYKYRLVALDDLASMDRHAAGKVPPGWARGESRLRRRPSNGLRVQWPPRPEIAAWHCSIE